MIRCLALSVLAEVSLGVLLAGSAQAQAMDAQSEVATKTGVTLAPVTLNSAPVAYYPQSAQSDTQVANRPEPKGAFYGYSILMTDLVALGVGALAVATISSSFPSSLGSAGGVLLVGSGLTYVLGGPIVHATHHKTRTAFGSFGLRLGLPVGGALVGAMVGVGSTQGCSVDSCGAGGIVEGGLVGFALGVVTASAIDIGVLAYEDVPKSTSPRFALVPAIDPKKGSASLIVQGIW
jgi:hypothetical protein